MRQETGVALAARFLGLLNSIKEKANTQRKSEESLDQEILLMQSSIPTKRKNK